jgi:hypothetical protein
MALHMVLHGPSSCPQMHPVDVTSKHMTWVACMTATHTQVSDFLAYTTELWERFHSSGPGLPTIELPVGLDLLHTYQVNREGGKVGLIATRHLCWMLDTRYPEEVPCHLLQLTPPQPAHRTPT